MVVMSGMVLMSDKCSKELCSDAGCIFRLKLWNPTVCRLHLIDFEQLKIENQTVNEKIEERNEELLKLRKKNTTTVQVTHA